MNVLQIIIFACVCFSSLLVDDIYTNGIIVFWSYLIVLLIEIVQKKSISFLSIFLVAFLFMIPKEAILNSKELYAEWGQLYTNKGFSYLIVSSFAVFLGFKFADMFFTQKWKFETKNRKIIIQKRKTLLFIIIAYNITLFFVNLENTIFGFTLGRASAYPYAYSSLLYSIAFIIVGLTKYLTNSKIKTILLSLPIIITFIGTGTRFFLVFVLFIIFFEDLYKFSLKKSLNLLIGAFLIVIVVNTMVEFRSRGIAQAFNKQKTEISFNNLTEKVVSYGSSEGLIRNMAMVTKYTTEVGYTYGKSIGFLGIFWIPRELWPSKPVMLDYWLIREYSSGFGDGFSTASSYGGELYMDFGFTLATLILLICGFYLCKLNLWIKYNYSVDLRKYILSAFLYGWLFFGTRSIMTSTFMLIYLLVASPIIFSLLYKYKIIRDH